MFKSPRKAQDHFKQMGVYCPSYEKLRQLAKDGVIKSERFQNQWMLDMDSIEKYLEDTYGGLSDSPRKKTSQSKPALPGERKRRSAKSSGASANNVDALSVAH